MEGHLHSHASVADAFLKQYFVILDKSPEYLHKFYQEQSRLSWPGVDGVLTPVTTIKGIDEKIMSSDYKDCSLEFKTTDSQESQDRGILVAVTGCLTRQDNVKKNFSQTFFLAKQENGYFVLNDILRFFDVCSITPDASHSSDDKDDQAAPTQISAPRNTSDVSTPLDFKASMHNGKAKEASDNNLANAAASKPTESAERAIVAPVTSVKVRSVVTTPSNVPHKTTYASMLAKMAAIVSPRTVPVTSNVSKQAVPSPTPEPSSPRADVSPKVSTPSEGAGVDKASTTSSKVTPKPTSNGQSSRSRSTYSEVKGIYVGGLPYEITKQEIADAFKQFGPIQRPSETIQIRKHQDGFCYGFVEFDSADSARRAVEAHHVMFGDKQAYIVYKKTSNNKGKNNGKPRPATPIEQQNESSTGDVDDGWTLYTKARRVGGSHRSKH